MAGSRLIPPALSSPSDEVETSSAIFPQRPNLRMPVRQPDVGVETLVAPGFVAEAPLPVMVHPDDVLERVTLELPRRLKRALQAEVSARRDDPHRRSRASMKSVVLEALSADGFGQFIRTSDIEVQAGIFMKRQSAKLRQR